MTKYTFKKDTFKKEIFNFDPMDFLPEARRAFSSANGFRDSIAKHRRMLNLSERVLKDILPAIRPTAVAAAFDGVSLEGDTLTISGVEFSCPAFSQFDPSRIRRIYPFMLTVGKPATSLNGITAEVFADMWATVFSDTIVAALANKLNSQFSIYPGFYGFPLSSVGRFSSLLDSENTIGVSVREPGFVMIPVKTCCGLMFETSGPLPLPADDCGECTANRHWCIMCKNRG